MLLLAKISVALLATQLLFVPFLEELFPLTKFPVAFLAAHLLSFLEKLFLLLEFSVALLAKLLLPFPAAELLHLLAELPMALLASQLLVF